MTMSTAFSATMPGSPSNASSASADSPTLPRTPETPSSALQPMLPDLSTALSGIAPAGAVHAPAPATGAPAAGSTASAGKRKTSRRANTAERRATHNAVERQRRETLNGRFLDLAGLLPNLSQIRRPSKSAIVNSSIAHVFASRRHRALAARELRLVKLEADAYRREINQWRERAGLPSVEEPVRSDGFAHIMSGEIEMEQELASFNENYEDEDGYDEEDEYMQPPQPTAQQQQREQQQQQMALAQQQQQQQMAAAAQMASPIHEAPNPFGGLHRQLQQAAVAARMSGAGPTPAQMAAAGFDNSGVPYGFDSRLLPHGHPAHFQSTPTAHYVNSGTPVSLDDPSWAQSMYNAAMAAKGSYTPPMTSHGGAYGLTRMPAQQMMHAGHVYGSPIDGDDGSSGVGSAPSTAHGLPMGRARSSSNATMSVGSYDQDYALGAHVPIPQGRARGISVSTGVSSIPNSSWDGVVSPGHNGLGMRTSPITIPGASVNMGAGAAMAMMF
jgi:hypothetical protein